MVVPERLELAAPHLLVDIYSQTKTVSEWIGVSERVTFFLEEHESSLVETSPVSQTLQYTTITC